MLRVKYADDDEWIPCSEMEFLGSAKKKMNVFGAELIEVQTSSLYVLERVGYVFTVISTFVRM
jgi:hypothetical protein